MKQLKFALGLKWKFSTEKSFSRQQENIRKSDFAPSEKYYSYATEHGFDKAVFGIHSLPGKSFIYVGLPSGVSWGVHSVRLHPGGV